jgi:ABC-type transporter Mla MlaB component
MSAHNGPVMLPTKGQPTRTEISVAAEVVNNTIQFTSTIPLDDAQVQLIDANGNVVLTQLVESDDSGDYSIDISGLASGTYTINLTVRQILFSGQLTL